MISIELLWKATAILAAAFVASAALRRSSAAVRHFLWTAAFAALLLLPAALRIVPRWNAPVTRPAVMTGVAPRPMAPVGQAATAPATRGMPLMTLWWTGLLLTAARFLAGAARTTWIVRNGRELDRRGGVRILASNAAPMPMTWGIARPVVVFPASASGWAPDRMDAVLAHELAHVQRRDVLAQSIAQAACCLYWFHPLVWMALRELRREREHACDDAVLHSGVPAHAYASHLMELARDMAARRVWLADAPAMAGTSHLETRIRAMLSAGRNRNPLRRRAALSVAAIAAFAFLPLSSIYVFAQAGTGTITGIARDPSGARVPNCTVTAKNLDSANQETTTADNTGEYRLGVPSGRYVVSFAASGFKMQRREITLVAGALVQIDGNLEVGGISESVHVSVGPKITVPRSGSVKPPERIRIGGNVSMARLISQTKPFYPADVEAGLTGTVVLSAIIGKDGMIQNLKVVRSPDDRLARAVVEAVKQWRYEPTRLNGEPIEVITEIAVTFD